MADEHTELGNETYVVYGQGSWGWGTGLVQAKDNFRRHGGKLLRGYSILTFDADTEFHGIDQMGRYRYKGNPPTESDVAPSYRRPVAK